MKRSRDADAHAPTPPLSTPLADLAGKAILITGSTGGLGREIAKCCVEANARGVLICGRSKERGEAVVQEMRQRRQALAGDACIVEFCEADVSKPEDCEKMVAAAVKAFGTIDGLVNSAAQCFPRGTLENTSLDLWNTIMSINLTAPFLLTQKVAAHMKERKVRGSICNIGSICAHGGGTFILAYSCTKAALAVMTKNTATELRRHQIRVNQINMGWCLTDAEDKGQRAEKGDSWLEDADAASDIGRLLRPVDTATSVIHYLSDATVMVTGSIMDISPDVIDGMLPGAVG